MDYLQRIRNLREDRDLKQKDVADILHIKMETYSRYERGKLQIHIEDLISLAKYYDVDLNYICGISNCCLTYPKK